MHFHMATWSIKRLLSSNNICCLLSRVCVRWHILRRSQKYKTLGTCQCRVYQISLLCTSLRQLPLPHSIHVCSKCMFFTTWKCLIVSHDDIVLFWAGGHWCKLLAYLWLPLTQWPGLMGRQQEVGVAQKWAHGKGHTLVHGGSYLNDSLEFGYSWHLIKSYSPPETN